MCLDLDEALPYIYVDHWIGIPCSHGVVSLNTAVCLIKKPVSLPLALRSLSHKPLSQKLFSPEFDYLTLPLTRWLLPHSPSTTTSPPPP